MKAYFAGLLCVFLTLSCSLDNQKERPFFRYNVPNNITSLDPAFAKSKNNIWAVNHLYSTLVQFDDRMNIVPGIAHSWAISNEGLDYTFHLRDSVLFHPDKAFGDQPRWLIASDVVYSLKRLQDSKVNSPGSWVLSGRLNDEHPFSVLNDSTLVIHLKEPFPAMLGILTMQYCSVVAKEVVEMYGDDFRKHPIGTGPFEFVVWNENQKMILKRFDGYHDSQSHQIEGIEISFMTDRKTGLIELLTGNLDFQSGMDPSFQAILFDEKDQIKSEYRSRIKLIKSPYLNTEYLGINLNKAKEEGSILADVNFRKALNYGLNKEAMLESLRSSFGRPANDGFIPFGMASYKDEERGYKYNEDKAREYLTLSNYDSKKELITLFTNKDYVDLCLYAAKMWQKLGINVEVELLESSLLREMTRKGEVMFFRGSWIGDYPDDETFLTVFEGHNPAPPNYTRFSNGGFDSLYYVALNTPNPEARSELYRNMDSIIIDQAPVVFLFYDETLLLTSTRTEGISKNAFNLLRTDSLKLN